MPPKRTRKGQVNLRASTVAELNSYSYTLRALRTNAIIDAPGHILDVLSTRTASPSYSDSLHDAASGSLRAADNQASSSRLASPSASSLPAFVEGGPEFITLWPDAHSASYTPEWSFNEEIGAELRQAFLDAGKRVQIPLAHEASSVDALEKDDDYVVLSKEYSSVVVEEVRQTLTRIFGLLAMHRAEDAPDKAVFHQAMGWREVLDVLGGAGIVSDDVLDRVKARMSAALNVPHSGTKDRETTRSNATRPDANTSSDLATERLRKQKDAPGAQQDDTFDQILSHQFKKPPEEASTESTRPSKRRTRSSVRKNRSEAGEVSER